MRGQSGLACAISAAPSDAVIELTDDMRARLVVVDLDAVTGRGIDMRR